MANSFAKAERSRTKTIRQGGTEQRPRLANRKKARPVKVQYRYAADYPFSDSLRRIAGTHWRTFKHYRTRADAECAIAGEQHKHPGWYEFQISGDER